MIAPELQPSYPLLWPEGRPRSHSRKPALFRVDGRSLTWSSARTRLLEQVRLITPVGVPWRVTDMQLSTNIRITRTGARDQNVSRREPEDPGVAFYFSLDGKPHVLACDRWDTVYGNVGAIAAHIDALRGQERWGVADLKQAFAGHAALPAPDPWWSVLGVGRDASGEEIKRAYRNAARFAHPDNGGERWAWDRLQAALAAATEEGRV